MSVRVTPEARAKVEERIALKGDEDYALTLFKRHGDMSIITHIFSRQPTSKEISTYEDTSSRLKFRGQKAEIEGSITLASRNLYDALIDRVYDLRVGRHKWDGAIDRDTAKSYVPVLMKREAVRDFLSQVQGVREDDEDVTYDGDEVAGTPERKPGNA
jgi:hypothetical protein